MRPPAMASVELARAGDVAPADLQPPRPSVGAVPPSPVIGAKRMSCGSSAHDGSVSEQRLSSGADDEEDEEVLAALRADRGEAPRKAVRVERAPRRGTDADGEGERDLLPPPRHAPAATPPPAVGGSGALRFPRAAARSPAHRGAVTTLHSVAQLVELLGVDANARRTPAEAARYTPAPLHMPGAVAAPLPAAPTRPLHCGETVVIVLHRGAAHVAQLVNVYTEYLSQMRVVALDLSALPAHEYDDPPETDAGAGTAAPAAADQADSACSAEDGDTDEDETLFAGANATHHTQRSSPHRRLSRESVGDSGTAAAGAPSAAVPTGAGSSATSELSARLTHVCDAVATRVSRLMRLESVLDPLYFVQEANASGASEGDERGARKMEPLRLPAMVVWRAGGASPEDYSPYLPCTYSDGSSSTLSQQQRQFAALPAQTQTQPQCDAHGASPSQPRKPRYRDYGDYLRVHGGPLVVKQLNNVDQVHSLSLYPPVFTVAHLYKHIIETAKRAVLRELRMAEELRFPSSFEPVTTTAGADESADARAQRFFSLLDRESVKSRTVVYLGASWCPPCMRIVGEMPLFISENFNVDTTVRQQMRSSGGTDTGAEAVAVGDTDGLKDTKNLHVFVKADMDLAKPVFDLFKVEVIPTFIILDNRKLFETEKELLRLRRTSTETAPHGAAPLSLSAHDDVIGAAILRSELGRLQNSQRHLLNLFLEKHCATLSFDEDF